MAMKTMWVRRCPEPLPAVSVKPGMKVNPGDVLFTIEAMKMETAIHADRKGVVQ